MSTLRSLFVFVLSVLVAIVVNACTTTVAAAPAALLQGYTIVSPTITHTTYPVFRLGGDCSADDITLDLYAGVVDDGTYACEVAQQGAAPVVVETTKKDSDVPTTSTPVVPTTTVTPVPPTQTPVVPTTTTPVPPTTTTPEPPVVTPEPPVVTPEPTDEPKTDDCNKSNPGNDKCVGKEDNEHCDQGMCEQGDEGNKGNGNNPEKGKDNKPAKSSVPMVIVLVLVARGYWKRVACEPASDELRGMVLTLKGEGKQVETKVIWG